ncbi:MAG: hypothetical protein K8H86_07920 [Ignavibacteriaceae bacterium]|nr:hypothetical protein [Ignavibacteriaceae bacterium]
MNGILIVSGTVYAYNNLMSDLKTPTSAGTDAIRGINITSTTTSSTVGLYYNTIFLTASSVGANFGTTGIFHTTSTIATTASLDMRNNIVANNSTANGTGLVVAFRRSSGAVNTLNNYASASNNNDFYAGTPGASNLIYSDGTSTAQTMDLYKAGAFTAGTITPRDAASFSEEPTFLSTTGNETNYLHINTATPTQIESGGAPITSPIAVSDDYDGNARNASTPDIGGDEFTGTPLDLTAPSISYTALSNTASTSARTLTATITDATGVPTSGAGLPVLYWNINDGGWNSATASHSGGSSYQFSFGSGVALSDVVKYYVCAQDDATPNIGAYPIAGAGGFSSDPPAAGTPPTTPSSYTIIGAVSGTVTVGTAGDFATLTGVGGLFEAINNKVVTGSITANIITDITEDGTNALNQTVEEAIYTITIQPSEAANKTISGSYAGGLIRLNGADGITFDGRFSGSGNYLTVSNTSTSANSAAFQLISLGTGAGASNNTIRNCNIAAGSNSVTSTFGIFVGGAAISTSGTGNDNDNVTISYNTIGKAHYGVYAAATSAGVNNNLAITHNEIGSSNAAEYIYKYGLYIVQADGGDFSSNHIYNMSSATATPHGMYIGAGVINSSISRNEINNITYTGSGGSGGRGIYVNTGNAASSLTIDNNIIYNIGGDGYPSYSLSSMVGIYIDGTTGGLNIYYNTINMYGDFARSSATLTTAILFNSSTITSVDLRNNIFSNSMNNTTVTTDKNYAIYSSTVAGNFTNINYNDYYVSGAQGVLGYIASADKTTLGDWQTATTQDANSLAADPQFVSDTNLQPFTGSSVLAAGTPIAGITVDIEGTTRNVTTPSVGAYESGLAPAAVDWCNLQLPASATITEGETVAVYARVYEPGVTDAAGQGAGVECWIGWNSINSNPNTWTNWTAATYNVDAGNNDEYMAAIGSGITAGSYYYASRFKITRGKYQYGGYSVGGGNFWDGAAFVSGALTVNTFTTAPPYVQFFDGVTAPALPTGWKVEDTNSDVHFWKTAASNPKSAPNAMKYDFNSTNAANDWFFSPGIEMISGTTYEVSFWYRAELGSYPEKLELKYGAAANSAGMTSSAIFSNTNIINTTYSKGSGTITAPSTGTFYIGWHCFSGADQYNLFVDDVSIRTHVIAQ